MFTVNIEKECGCFKRSGIENNMTFETKEEALKEADLLIDEMNETFCRKHIFKLKIEGKTLKIRMDIRD